ncbi:hypothetical protein HBB16_19745 [Pseudonocardia sp. MCCB 268]|nr:hypothetical protein [Pseudonocardia cytotoxica]
MTEVETTVEVVQQVRAADGVVQLVLRNPGARCSRRGAGARRPRPGRGDDPAGTRSLRGSRPAHLREVAVAGADGRGGSAFVHDRLEAGATIRLRGPRNHFPRHHRYRFVAGGSASHRSCRCRHSVPPRGLDPALRRGGPAAPMAFADELPGTTYPAGWRSAPRTRPVCAD